MDAWAEIRAEVVMRSDGIKHTCAGTVLSQMTTACLNLTIVSL
jgi:hypothetical protein